MLYVRPPAVDMGNDETGYAAGKQNHCETRLGPFQSSTKETRNISRPDHFAQDAFGTDSTDSGEKWN